MGTAHQSSEAEESQSFERPSLDVPAILEKHGPIEDHPFRKSVTAHNISYVPFLYSRDRYIPLRAKHRILLDSYRPGVALASAASEAGMTEDQARAFFRRPIVREWLHDLEKDVALERGWKQQGRWWAEGHKIWTGEKPATKAQLVVWQEFGDRVVPKQSRSSSSEAPKIEINIDPGAVQEAFRRQSAIEAELAQ